MGESLANWTALTEQGGISRRKAEESTTSRYRYG